MYTAVATPAVVTAADADKVYVTDAAGAVTALAYYAIPASKKVGDPVTLVKHVTAAASFGKTYGPGKPVTVYSYAA